ncbi:3-oxoacyl-ACP reductase [Aliidongia dinghuensis]|uniref:3-oxoacyl-ACP reductase n=1 Tax=Aliidongia dinghuensis TaxID=1867774 RepID=A0A8J3E6L1_9PROT|nr:SDR family NAD(P)-dependent oxidoreductase [Aliidongia dinghuensis]GGF42068.1 3-oxoacyl-ACP reductase [Aliidongia dinghuensis]
MERYLEGRTAIVTGGMRGIGRSIAHRLHQRGARIAVWDYDTKGWDEAGEPFEPALIHRVDVSSHAMVEEAFAATLRTLGQVDILINNAGINGPVTPSWDYPVDAWEKVIGIDLNGVFYCCRAAIPHMRARKYGRIVNVASMAGKDGVQFISAYSAAKGGVIAFTKAAAKELAQDGVLINCVAPAMVETDLLQQMSEEHIRASKAKIPMGRFLQVEEVAAMVSWIAGPECSFTTGFVFDLSGGRATY